MKLLKSKVDEIKVSLRRTDIPRAKIGQSNDAYEFLKQLYDEETVELFEQVIVLYLNRANTVVSWQLFAIGGIDGTIIDIRIIHSTALKTVANAVILSHNHPSGNTSPSHKDIEVTRRLKDSLLISEITLLDHIIVTKVGYCSLADEGNL